MFSVVIPARNEAENLQVVVPTLLTALESAGINHEILVVNDGSTDDTRDVLVELASPLRQCALYRKSTAEWIWVGRTRRSGELSRGCRCHRDGRRFRRPCGPGEILRESCGRVTIACSAREFIAGSKLIDYPTHKLIINRLANLFIKVLFQLRYNDVTNAFKCYRRTVIAGLEPILAHHFNLTVELPLKAIIRGYSFAVIPISWTNRTSGVSKLKIREMGSRYLFIVIYCLIERLLSRGDYRRKPVPDASLEKPEAVASRKFSN